MPAELADVASRKAAPWANTVADHEATCLELFDQEGNVATPRASGGRDRQVHGKAMSAAGHHSKTAVLAGSEAPAAILHFIRPFQLRLSCCKLDVKRPV